MFDTEQIKENCKEINKMRREFQRETTRLENTDKKFNRELKRAIDKKEPMVSLATLRPTKRGSLRTSLRIRSSLRGTKTSMVSCRTPYLSTFRLYQRLQSMGTMEQMQKVMSGLANIMGNAQNQIKVQ
jgi:hypothetical protein